MQKFFTTSKNFTDDRATITGSDVHHIGNVLRKKPGDEIIITGEDNVDFRGRIEAITPFEIRVQILEQLPSSFQNKRPVILAQAIPKHTKMDLIIQKATELGAEEIIPLTSRYSFVNSHGTISQARWARWQRICREAAKQCGRNNLPKLHPPTPFSALRRLETEPNLLRLLLWEKEHQNRLKNILARHNKAHKIIVLIGPEGSFSSDEIRLAIDTKFIPVSCAPWVLRTETAAIYTLSIIQYELNFL